MTDAHARELAEGERFAFGDNWAQFLRLVNEPRIEAAAASLARMLGVDTLRGKRFLDAGSGSGLFSLAARRLGADVVSFDYDPQSVACTAALRDRYSPGDACWRVDRGSVLDRAYVASLGTFDVVYSWGVLHHTGAMWDALDTIADRVGPGGALFIALYNDQGWKSRYWRTVKHAYVAHPILRWPLLVLHLAYPFSPALAFRLLSGRPPAVRGMSFWRDVIDWVGGYPFEVATSAAVQTFCRERGFVLDTLQPTSRAGCNEFVFHRQSPSCAA